MIATEKEPKEQIRFVIFYLWLATGWRAVRGRFAG
jgi:hypothetical protein